MKFIKILLLSLSLLTLGTISALSVQDLIDSGECPQIEELWLGYTLNLSEKKLTSLEGLNKIENIKHVKIIDLSNNLLSKINEKTFSKLSNLQALYLDNNKIAFIHKNAFATDSNIWELTLNNNNLYMINPKLFKSLPVLDELNIKNNFLNIQEIKSIQNAYDGDLTHAQQNNPLELARKKFNHKNLFYALRARELGVKQFARTLHQAKSKKRKRDSSDNNESLAKKVKKS